MTKEPQRLRLDVVVPSNAKTEDHYILTLDTVGTLLACDDVDFNVVIMEQTKAKYDGMFDHISGNVITVNYEFRFNYNKCLNEGAKLGDSDHILFCNNDLIFHRFSIKRLFKGMEKFRSVSPYCNLSHPTKMYNNPVMSGNVLRPGYQIGGRVAGWAIMMERSVWDEIGGFDEGVDFWYSDNIYADQIRDKGIEHALVCNAFVDHLMSRTLRTDKNKVNLTRNQRKKYELARRKYG